MNVTVVVGFVGLATLGPLIGNHVPVPIVGATAVSVGVNPQKKMLGPALTGPTFATEVIESVEELDGQTPFEIVHCKIFVPVEILVKADNGEVGETIVPVPEISDQLPVPIAGMLAVKVVLLTQIVWLVPALETDGLASRCMLTVEVVFGHTPLPIVH